jgi:hypothetical protein
MGHPTRHLFSDVWEKQILRFAQEDTAVGTLTSVEESGSRRRRCRR